MSTGIEWTDATWNPVIGCAPVSPGCLNCYAARMALRMQANPATPDYHPRRVGGGEVRIAEVRGGRPVFTGEVRCLPERLDEPLRWRKPRRVFVNSMSDLFHEDVPFEFIDRVFAVMALCPQHTFQVLMKRPGRMAEYLTERRADQYLARDKVQIRADEIDAEAWAATTWPLPNVWLGTSVENQKTADERIPRLMGVPAAVRFLSCEPLLGPLDISAEWLGGIGWVIVGGESGPGARPCDMEWIRAIVRQCRAADAPVFVKQLGSNVWCPETRQAVILNDRKGGDMAEWPADLRVREWPR